MSRPPAVRVERGAEGESPSPGDKLALLKPHGGICNPWFFKVNKEEKQRSKAEPLKTSPRLM